MKNRIKIISIGASNSGKTCLLYAMYAEMAFGINGFTFMPTDYNDALKMEVGWEGIIKEHRWPEGNTESASYIFECSYSYKQILSFTWEDYRGGLWHEHGSSELNALIQKLHESEAIFLFVDAQTLLRIQNGERQAERALRDISNLLLSYRQKHEPVPVVLILTKADLFQSDEGKIEEALKLLKERYLQSLFQDGGKWPVMITATSMGANLGGKQGDQIEGNIRPKNIHLPVMFSIHNRMSAILHAQKEEVQAYESMKNSAQEQLSQEFNRGWWSRIWRADRSTTYQGALQDAERELKQQQISIEKMISDLVKIEKELREGRCSLYYDGHKFQFKEQ